MLLEQALRSPEDARVGQQLLELGNADLFESDEDRLKAVAVRNGEEDIGSSAISASFTRTPAMRTARTGRPAPTLPVSAGHRVCRSPGLSGRSQATLSVLTAQPR